MEKVYKKQRLDYFWAQVCPICGEILSSASEKDLLPEFSYCNCQEIKRKGENDV